MSRPALPSLPVKWAGGFRLTIFFVVFSFSRARGKDLMAKSKVAAKLENIVFLSNIRASLRWATSDIARENLPEEIVRLLRRLDRIEYRQTGKK
jgi:hypothetical protein